jgi:hypothetical protein
VESGGICYPILDNSAPEPVNQTPETNPKLDETWAQGQRGLLTLVSTEMMEFITAVDCI